MNRGLRSLAQAAFKLVSRLQSPADRSFLMPDVPLSKRMNHSRWQSELYALAGREGMRVLEIGSRAVTGPSSARQSFSPAHYVGFDFYPGDNVDVVGDVHKLSSYFPQNEGGGGGAVRPRLQQRQHGTLRHALDRRR